MCVNRLWVTNHQTDPLPPSFPLSYALRFQVPAVSRQEDVDWAMKESGLPFLEVLLLPTLPKSAGLPVGTTQQGEFRPCIQNSH